MPIRVVEVEVERKAAVLAAWLATVGRRLEAGLVDDVGVQLEDRRAQFADGGDEGGICAAQGRVKNASGLVDLVPRREQVLDRLMERLGKCLALALLGRQRVGQQPSAALGELQTASVRRASRSERRTQASPEEKPPA